MTSQTSLVTLCLLFAIGLLPSAPSFAQNNASTEQTLDSPSPLPPPAWGVALRLPEGLEGHYQFRPFSPWFTARTSASLLVIPISPVFVTLAGASAQVFWHPRPDRGFFMGTHLGLHWLNLSLSVRTGGSDSKTTNSAHLNSLFLALGPLAGWRFPLTTRLSLSFEAGWRLQVPLATLTQSDSTDAELEDSFARAVPGLLGDLLRVSVPTVTVLRLNVSL